MKLSAERPDANALLRIFEAEYPPVDVESMARKLGIDIQAEPLGEVSGSLNTDRSTGLAVIRVRRDHVPWRQRFTIAHELGHLMLGHANDSTTCYRFTGGAEETAANRYAADLLMPLWMLEPLAIKHGADTALLAKIFEVSEEAMNIRISVLTGLRR